MLEHKPPPFSGLLVVSHTEIWNTYRVLRGCLCYNAKYPRISIDVLIIQKMMIKAKKCNCCNTLEKFQKSFLSGFATEYSRCLLTLYLPSALCLLISPVFFQLFTNKNSWIECNICVSYSQVTLGVDVNLLHGVLKFYIYQSLCPSISIGLLRDHTVGDTSAIAESNSLASQPSSAKLNHPPALPLARSTILIPSLEETYLLSAPAPDFWCCLIHIKSSPSYSSTQRMSSNTCCSGFSQLLLSVHCCTENNYQEIMENRIASDSRESDKDFSCRVFWKHF